MKSAPIPKDEKERLTSLHKLGILDTEPEERFDRITRTATKIFNVSISTLTLVDSKREWFKSVCGLDQKEGDRAISFCGHALFANEILVIPDTKKDVRFSDNPMVIGKPYIRFYAGVPVTSVDGQRIGVFCVKDTKPRAFSKNDEDVLVGLAAWAELEIDSRNLGSALNEEREMRAKFKAQASDLENAKIAARNVLEDLSIEKAKIEIAMVKEEAILLSVGDGLLATDEKGNITLINKTAEKLLGKKKEEIVGKVFSEIIVIEDENGVPIPSEKQPANMALTGGTTTTGPTYYYVRPDKTKFPVAITVTPIMLLGKIIGMVEIFRDITKEKELEKMRMDFLSLASHQLRTPLSGTKWLIETMQRGITGEITQKQKEYLGQIYAINERMIKFVFDMLNVLRLESGVIPINQEEILVSKLYDDLVTLLEPAAKSRGVILRNTPKDREGTMVKTDAQILRSILEVFISNAINYSLRGREVILCATDKATTIIFSVKDSGIGIPKEEQKKIFERFYRASNAKELKPEGTGLGLYVASVLAEKIGAKVSFESEENKGSTFYLRIPKKLNI